MRRAKQKMRCRYNLPPLTDTTYKGNRKEGKIMKATGIVRRIDELGRVVIPKEIRRTSASGGATRWRSLPPATGK